jgi:hypothetical protein
MHILIIILVFILITVIAILIGQFTYLGVLSIRGAGESNSKLATEIIEMFQSYIDETGIRNITEHLEKFYYTGKVPQIRKKIAEKSPSKYLEALIGDIIYENNIDNSCEFIEVSHINYSTFLKKELVEILNHYYNVSASSLDVAKLKKLSESDSTDAKEFLRNHRLYKFTKDAIKMPIKKLKAEIAKNPDDYLEIDIIGLLPMVKLYESNGTSKSSTSDISELKEIKKYLEDYGLLKRAASVWTWRDLATLLRQRGLSSDYEREREREKLREKNRQLHDENVRESEKNRRLREENERERERAKNAQRVQIARQEPRREQEREAAERRERELEVAFYEKVRADPELERVAAAMGMSLHDLFEQYKAEQAIGGADENNVEINMTILQKIKDKLKARIN